MVINCEGRRLVVFEVNGTQNGFRFHHTRGDEVAMVRWLAPEESRIPVFAHTLVGAGAVVINSEGRLLVVQERYQNTAYWKLPGGYVEPGKFQEYRSCRQSLLFPKRIFV